MIHRHYTIEDAMGVRGATEEIWFYCIWSTVSLESQQPPEVHRQRVKVDQISPSAQAFQRSWCTCKKIRLLNLINHVFFLQLYLSS